MILSSTISLLPLSFHPTCHLTNCKAATSSFQNRPPKYNETAQDLNTLKPTNGHRDVRFTKTPPSETKGVSQKKGKGETAPSPLCERARLCSERGNPLNQRHLFERYQIVSLASCWFCTSCFRRRLGQRPGYQPSRIILSPSLPIPLSSNSLLLGITPPLPSL